MATLLGKSNFSGKYGSHYFYSVYYDYTQDLVNNKTTLTLYGYIGGDGYASGSGSAQTCYIDGRAIGSFTSISANSNVLIGSIKKEIPHNSDGTFPNTTISAYCNTLWTNVDNASISVTLTSAHIKTIARKSTLGAISNFTFDENENVGVPFLVPIVKRYNDFYNVLKISLLNDTSEWTLIATKENFNGEQITFTTLELQTIYSNMKRMQTTYFKFELVTYLNSAKTNIIGTDLNDKVYGSMSLTGFYPTFNLDSVQFEDVNSKTYAFTNDKNVFIKNYSDIKITFTEKGSANKGAILEDNSYVAQVKTANGTKTSSLNHSDVFPKSLLFEKISDDKISIFLFDSRSVRYPDTNVLKTVPIWNYEEVSFDTNASKVFRIDGVEEETFLNLKGTYYDFEEKPGVNLITTATLKYRENNNSSDYIETNITSYIVCENGSFSLDNYNVGNLDVTKEYEVVIEIEDKLSKTTLNLSLNSAKPYLWHMKKKKIMGIGGKPDSNLSSGSIHLYGDIKVDGKYIDIYPVGSIYMSINNTNPSTLFGGTWEQIKDCFLLSAGNKYIAGSVGGEEQVTLKVSEMPSHTHTQNPHGHSQHPSTWMNVGSSQIPRTGGYYYANAEHSADYWTGNTTATNNYTGGSGPHNNMPPYLVVYVWKRVS